MKRPVSSHSRRSAGYTLIEILVATTLSLLLLGAVVAMFGAVGGAITDSRSMLEMADRLRLTGERLQMDLAGLTVTMNPPQDPANNKGYFELIKAPVPAVGTTFAVNTDNGGAADPTVGNFGDILMFTTRSNGRPFIGRFLATAIQSDLAEVAWFVRGRTLHRRVLLVCPNIFDSTSPGDNILEPGELSLPTDGTGFYAKYDVSVRAAYSGGTFQGYTPNTLGDLTRRECRFAHCGSSGLNSSFPYDVRNWYWTVSSYPTQRFPTLPTLNECSSPGWTVDQPAKSLGVLPALDFWTNNPAYRVAESALVAPASGMRIADDVILTNVIGFDVKMWDPVAGGYVDLGNAGPGRFSIAGSRPVSAVVTMPNVYDTWSTHYEALAGTTNNGLDDGVGGANGIVDDDSEKTYAPPYPYPLRAIQVKIRTFEPDSRQIREWTVVQEFLPQ